MAELEYEEVVKATDNFNPTRIIGKGSHGKVYRGTMLFKHNNNNNNNNSKSNKLEVAIKKPSQGLESLHDKSKLENEIRVLSSLRESPHVVKLLGTSNYHDQHHLIVMELMPNGSLHDCLHHAATKPKPKPKTLLPSWHKRVEIAMQIARAVEFLHEGKPMVIHRDIKSSNILFDSEWNAKLGDFGLAVNGEVDPPSQPAGTIGYLDPCYTSPSKLSTKNDMFSFGVVVLEIISGRKAIDVCKTPASVVEWATPLIGENHFHQIFDPRLAPPASAHVSSSITRLLRYAARCVSPNEELRPSATEVLAGMENCFLERVRFSVWRNVLTRFGMVPKTRTRIQCIHTVSLPLTIKEILALE